jgi:hypothetical protein
LAFEATMKNIGMLVMSAASECFSCSFFHAEPRLLEALAAQADKQRCNSDIVLTSRSKVNGL